MASTGMPAVGIAAIGMGVLCVFSAYTKIPIFGDKGMIRLFIASNGSYEAAGKAAGQAVVGLAEQFKPAASPPASDPPGKIANV